MALADLIVAVALDLASFARDSVHSLLRAHRSPQLALPFIVSSNAPEVVEAPIYPEDSDVSMATFIGETSHEADDPILLPSSFKSTAAILADSTPRALEVPIASIETIDRGTEKNTVMYAASERIPLWKDAYRSFDGVLAHIPYGAMIVVLGSQGDYLQAAYKEKEGWVLREDVAEPAGHVYPEFMIGAVNEASDPNTLRLRACIEDELGGGAAHYTLNSGEYVLYKLYRKGKTILWNETRPRTPGQWHVLLKGTHGIHIGIHPKSGSIMEFTLVSGEGHLAYVEGVTEDGMLTISEVDFPDRGIYNERILTKEEWVELAPVFITIN